MNRSIFVFIICVAIVSGCYYDREDVLYPAGNCDTSNSTYSAVVQPLLQTYGCLGCHSGPAPSGNLSLATYHDVKLLAQNGKIYGSITHSSGYAAMPQGGNKMSSCDINKIKAWIDTGALNN